MKREIKNCSTNSNVQMKIFYIPPPAAAAENESSLCSTKIIKQEKVKRAEVYTIFETSLFPSLLIQKHENNDTTCNSHSIEKIVIRE